MSSSAADEIIEILNEVIDLEREQVKKAIIEKPALADKLVTLHHAFHLLTTSVGDPNLSRLCARLCASITDSLVGWWEEATCSLRQILELVHDGTFPYDDFPFRESDLKQSYHQAYKRISGYVHGNYEIESLEECSENVRQVVDICSAMILARFGRSLSIEQDHWADFLHHAEEFRLDASKQTIAHIIDYYRSRQTQSSDREPI